MDYCSPGSPIHGNLQARSGVPQSSPEDLPNPGIELRSPALQADYLPSEPPEKPRATDKLKEAHDSPAQTDK